MAITEKIVAFGPRPPGSEALRQVGDYILGELEALGIEASAQEWAAEPFEANGKKVTPKFRNLWAKIPGTDDKGRVLLLAAHYDSKITAGHPNEEHNFPFVGAIDAAGSCAILLELARHLKARKSKPTIWLVWFDGEENFEFEWGKHNEDKALHGSRHFVKALPSDQRRKIKTMVLFDLLGSKNPKIDRDNTSDANLVKLFQRVGEAHGVSDRIFRFESPMTDDHVPFQKYGVRTIDLIDFRWRTQFDWDLYDDTQRLPGPRPNKDEFVAWWHTEQDNLTQMAPESLAFAGNLFWQALPEIEASEFR